MGLINTAKTVLTNLANDGSQVADAATDKTVETIQNVPSVNDIVSKGQETANNVVNTAANLVTTVLSTEAQLEPGRIAQASQVVNDLAQNIKGILEQLDKSVNGHLELQAKFSIDPEKLLTTLGTAMSAAEGSLTKRKGSDLFISDGTIVTEFYVKLPGPASGTGAFARVELNLKSKQYLALTAGKG